MQRSTEISVEEAPISTLATSLLKRILFHPTTVKLSLLASIVSCYLYLKFSKKKSLKGKTVVVTGAGNGIGRAQAIALAKQGCKVIIWDIDETGLKATADLVKQKYPSAEVFAYKVNLVNRESVYALAEQVKREHGFVWGLINNAGILIGKSLMETPDNKIELTMGVNIMAHFWTVKAFLQPMLDRNDGHIVGISSAAGFFPSARMIEYCTSKYAARGFMEALRIELNALGKSGVKSTLIAPAHVNTDLFSGYSLGGTMEPDWVAEQIVVAMQLDKAIAFLPWYVSLGNLWQGVLPTFIWDIFMLPTNSQLDKWNPTQANKVFEKMEKKD